MKKILLIGTGGTIASEMGENGLAPELTSQQLLRYLPDIAKIAQVDCLQLFSLDSTNIQPKHWVRIADAIAARYKDYDGFVISHGTDTMAYTAAALSYLIQRSAKPIVLTGAQKPIGFDSTDSKVNLYRIIPASLLDSFIYFWILQSLLDTIQELEDKKQTGKLDVFISLRNIIIVAVIVSTLYNVLFSYLIMFKKIDSLWKYQWFFNDGVWTSSYLLLVAVIMVSASISTL